MTFDQAEFDARCEWGLAGFTELAPVSGVTILVDVLSFSTAVDIAVGNGAEVLPYPWKDESAASYAEAQNARLAASGRTAAGFTLSPSSLRDVPRGCRLVLPSPNGSALAWAARHTGAFTACLRNARAVAEAAARRGTSFAVIPAGERWADGGLRPCLEDLAGAGAVLAHLPGRRSPEAELAVQAFQCFEEDLLAALSRCGSGRELIERGFEADVELAAQINVSSSAPWLDPRRETVCFSGC